MKKFNLFGNHDNVEIYIIPGCRMPERQLKRDDNPVGFDVYTRAIVSLQMDEANPLMRHTLFDFKNEPRDLPLYDVECFPNMGKFRLAPHHQITLGCGFVLIMNENLCAYIEPRGSTAGRGLIAPWASVPIDPQFRGEPVFSIYNPNPDFVWFDRHERLMQLVFRPVVIPRLAVITDTEKLFPTKRGNLSNGSSGKL